MYKPGLLGYQAGAGKACVHGVWRTWTTGNRCMGNPHIVSEVTVARSLSPCLGSCRYRVAATAPKKKVQTTLTNLVVRGTNSIIQETKQKLGNSLFPHPLSPVGAVSGTEKGYGLLILFSDEQPLIA